ncbi:MAG: S8 family serine peptidase [Gammaproteobacteria bacterium]|nr:S8 family serine peptidase [Gammaproteobacteria bacterium]
MSKRLIQSILASIFLVSSGLTFAEPPADLVALANSTVICGFTDKVLPGQASTVAKAAIQSATGKGRHVYTTAFRGFSARMSATAATNLVEHNPNIDFCEQNGLGQAGGIPAQAGAKGGNGGKPGQQAEQTTPWGVTRVGGPLDGSNLSAWIIDSGIDTSHPDLIVDANRGGDFVTGKGKDTVEDGNGHGTHIAGTLAAIDNTIDVVGVAAGATVIPVRVLQKSGWAAIDEMVAGIDFVAANANPGTPGNHGDPTDVANMSVWAWGHYKSLHAATLGLADVIPFVIIAGNDGEDINERPSEPSHVVHDNLYVVSAIDEFDIFTDFSNYGYAIPGEDCDGKSTKDPYPCGTVNIAAPGKDIESLKPGGGLAIWHGTSMAAPHVAGVILATETVPAPTFGTANSDPDGYADPIVTAPQQ